MLIGWRLTLSKSAPICRASDDSTKFILSISADPGRRKGERVREEDVLHCYYFGRNFDAFPSCRALLFERGGGAVSELGNSHPGAVF